MARNPAFAVTAVAVLAAGIGANTAIFTVIRAVLLLAMVGIYGAIAYSVTQRTQEVGIRRALGAQHADVLRLILGQGFRMVLAGLAIGVGAALALTVVMGSMLFHVNTTDPAAFLGISALFVVVSMTAGYIPARRAAKIDPMAALRVG